MRGKHALFRPVARNSFTCFVWKVFAPRKLLPGKFWVVSATWRFFYQRGQLAPKLIRSLRIQSLTIRSLLPLCIRFNTKKVNYLKTLLSCDATSTSDDTFLKNVVLFPLYSKLSTCIPVFLQVLRQSRVCGAQRAREPGKWVLSWWLFSNYNLPSQFLQYFPNLSSDFLHFCLMLSFGLEITTRVTTDKRRGRPPNQQVWLQSLILAS